ncbi:predicted protein [Nematostella vectensis]|uniref:Uncharacterized protein n=1 Tax=Nematostella vectensis TaxID=45351 RepID=A7T9N2_NEMVE|nr:predicted protein [Nematostella vectensis]|eukprot:XP_001619392.1 hypothetical protein NEMVEDRAFT_v1g224231 [Nematostella vectensis]
MASGYVLPPPAPLEIHNSNAADKWKRFVLAWKNYSLATGLNEKAEAVQVATLLTVIGEEAREVYSTFTLTEGETDKIEPVIKKFAEYCQPRKNDGWTALIAACKEGCSEVAKELLESGARLQLADVVRSYPYERLMQTHLPYFQAMEFITYDVTINLPPKHDLTRALCHTGNPNLKGESEY